ncbi:MAG: outer rane lipase/esterase [Methylobacteriaceae bacterium]|nr:outer rane lipase/esterase [Methylobacteriaceae bacterium]
MIGTGIKRRIRSAVCAGALLAGSAVASQAQSPFTSVYGFGDSYADIGNLFRITHTFSPIYPTGRFSGGTNFVDTMSFLLGVPQANFAIGGATTGATNVVGPGIPGFLQEWTGFLATGGRFLPTDVLALSIGGNDARAYYQSGGSLAGAPAAASVAATQAIAGVSALIGAGARNVVFTVGDVSTLPESIGRPNVAAGSLFSQTYNLQTQSALALFARAGVRVEYVDIALIGREIGANPALYGFTSAGPCPLTCLGNPALQNQFLFYVDALHLTSHGFAVLGEYIVNRLDAPLTLPAQGDLGLRAAEGFAAVMFGRLDLFREQSIIVPEPLAYAPVRKGPFVEPPPPPPPSPLSVYILANGGFGSRSTTPQSFGYNWDAVGGTIGAEYRVTNNAFIGAAFNYANPSANALNGNGKTDTNAYQFGVYGAWVDAHFFAQGFVGGGVQQYRNSRFGVVDVITSNPTGSSLIAGGKVGYLFNVGPALQIGPIVGATYARADIKGFTENGDPALVLTIGPQRVETIVGSAGAQIRYPVIFNGVAFNPYLNLTADDDLRGNGRIIQFGAVSAPLITNTWTVPNGSHRIYGRVAGGVQADVVSSVAVTLTASRTIGRQGGDDFYGSGGIKVRF